jgi:hypothetical protein
MTRKHGRRDSVGDRVAHQLIWKTASEYFTEMLPNFTYDLPGLLEVVEESQQTASESVELRQVLRVLRQPELRAVFTSEESPSARNRLCKACSRTLTESGRGRRPEYCSSACRQLAHRRRKGQKTQEPMDPTIELMFMLCELEVELLRESAYRAVDERAHKDTRSG